MKLFTPHCRNVVILGCGPSGIFAAHAAVQAGKDVRIFSRKRVSQMYGAQYLQGPVPGLSLLPSVDVTYTLQGSSDEYAQKVYGDTRPPFIISRPTMKAWDIREAYENGWKAYEQLITPMSGISQKSLSPNYPNGHGALARAYADSKYTQIISTIPAPSLCTKSGEHTFRGRNIWALGSAPELGQLLNDFEVPDNTVINNGEKAPSWYRVSNVFNYKTVEWPFERKPPVHGVAEVGKVLGTNCDCFAPRIWRAGRLGTWNKMVLAHHAYEYTLAGLS